MEKLIDMHVHTCYSDGEYEPNEVISHAIDEGVGTIAITDHDTLEGVKRINYDNRKFRCSEIKIFNGIELSAKVKHGRMHILGYDLDLSDEKLNAKMEDLRNNSLQSVLSIMEQIKRDYGIMFNYKDIQDLVCANHNLGRPDLAKLCIKYGYAKTIKEAFDKYLVPSYERIRGKNKGLSFEECLDLINGSGGVAILAHPKTLNLSEADFLVCLRELINNGLKGIEVYHSIHSDKEKEFYHNVALEYDLLESVGSDFHGPTVNPNIKIGIGDNNIKVKKISLVDYLNKR